ncbi:M48 family metallopeptidase [Anaerotardibacter muris]|uniref:M48 family metallopeptidase n=1 Tax=Anaerotardibacter muris TaxID=2941505 RepID=UPI0020411952|nr:SprT family zinc-dependent metalloprotease [Anaerotardibacter muris]
MKETTLHVEGIPISIVRKRMKTVRLKVKSPGGEVCMSAPYHVTNAELERFAASRIDWIRVQRARIAASPAAHAQSASKEEIEAWRAVVKACVPPLVEQWAPILGVHPKKIDYRNMKSRWGSCQPETGRLCFNIRLALYPPECLEYVVVHELCHFLEANHGPGFHALMDRVMPDWRTRKKKLN